MRECMHNVRMILLACNYSLPGSSPRKKQRRSPPIVGAASPEEVMYGLTVRGAQRTWAILYGSKIFENRGYMLDPGWYAVCVCVCVCVYTFMRVYVYVCMYVCCTSYCVCYNYVLISACICVCKVCTTHLESTGKSRAT